MIEKRGRKIARKAYFPFIDDFIETRTISFFLCLSLRRDFHKSSSRMDTNCHLSGWLLVGAFAWDGLSQDQIAMTFLSQKLSLSLLGFT